MRFADHLHDGERPVTHTCLLRLGAASFDESDELAGLLLGVPVRQDVTPGLRWVNHPVARDEAGDLARGRYELLLHRALLLLVPRSIQVEDGYHCVHTLASSCLRVLFLRPSMMPAAAAHAKA